MHAVRHARVEVSGTAGEDVDVIESVHGVPIAWEEYTPGTEKGKSRSLTPIREKRDWVRDDNVKADDTKTTADPLPPSPIDCVGAGFRTTTSKPKA